MSFGFELCFGSGGPPSPILKDFFFASLKLEVDVVMKLVKEVEGDGGYSMDIEVNNGGKDDGQRDEWIGEWMGRWELQYKRTVSATNQNRTVTDQAYCMRTYQ